MFERSSKGDCEGTTMLLVEGMLELLVEVVASVEVMVFGSDTMKKTIKYAVQQWQKSEKERDL